MKNKILGIAAATCFAAILLAIPFLMPSTAQITGGGHGSKTWDEVMEVGSVASITNPAILTSQTFRVDGGIVMEVKTTGWSLEGGPEVTAISTSSTSVACDELATMCAVSGALVDKVAYSQFTAGLGTNSVTNTVTGTNWTKIVGWSGVGPEDNLTSTVTDELEPIDPGTYAIGVSLNVLPTWTNDVELHFGIFREGVLMDYLGGRDNFTSNNYRSLSFEGLVREFIPTPTNTYDLRVYNPADLTNTIIFQASTFYMVREH